MELKQIKELMAAMERAGIKKLIIKEKTGSEVHLERQDEYPHGHPAPAVVYHAPHPEPHHRFPSHPPAAASRSVEGEALSPQEKKEEKVSGKYVKSPMVGTFYASPSPDDPHFVKVGDKVEENTVICIIEAMKVMNEVKAGASGTVAEIYVENAHPVEFGTKLFRIV